MEQGIEKSLQQELTMLNRFLETLPEKIWNLSMRVIAAFLILFIGLKLIKLTRKVLHRSLERANLEKGVVQFLESLVKYLLYIILVITIASNFGFDATSVVALLGTAGVTIGLALQGSLSNLAGGILILILRPFQVGDYITEDSNGNAGTVQEIGVFYTKLRTSDCRIIVLPNGTLANTSLTNFSEAKHRRVDLSVGISYDASIDQAKNVVLEVLEQDEAVVRKEEIMVFVESLGASEVIIGLRCFCDNADYWTLKYRILENVKKAFDANGIEIPYQQVVVHQVPTTQK